MSKMSYFGVFPLFGFPTFWFSHFWWYDLSHDFILKIPRLIFHWETKVTLCILCSKPYCRHFIERSRPWNPFWAQCSRELWHFSTTFGGIWLILFLFFFALQDKFNQLLSLLPDLREMAQRGEDFLYFKHMQGHAPHHTLLMEMLLAKRNDVVSCLTYLPINVSLQSHKEFH